MQYCSESLKTIEQDKNVTCIVKLVYLIHAFCLVGILLIFHLKPQYF